MSDYTPEVGHRVEVIKRWTGVVTDVHDDVSFLFRRDGVDRLRWVHVDDPDNATVTRLPDPEPEWQPGDVAKDAEGRLFARSRDARDGYPWIDLSARPGDDIWFSDDELARPLTPLVLNGTAVTP